MIQRPYPEASSTDITIPPHSVRNECSTGELSAVLLIGFEHALDDACRRSLSAAGINVVVSASNGEQALELANAHRLFDAVIVGGRADDTRTVELVRKVTHCRPGAPTFVRSSELSSESSRSMGKNLRRAITASRQSNSR